MRYIVIGRLTISFGKWVTPMWLKTAYGPQVQLGWVVISYRSY